MLNTRERFKKYSHRSIRKGRKHPDADKLLIVDVNTGSETIQVVTGATNIKKVQGSKHYSSTIVGGKNPFFKITRCKSAGMLCSAEELGLDDLGLPKRDSRGILILPEMPFR